MGQGGNTPKYSSEYFQDQACIIHAIEQSKTGNTILNQYPRHKKPKRSKSRLEDTSRLLAPVEELFIAGGGGAGRTLPGAFQEARRYGLNLNNIKVVCGTSVGSIIALGITLGIPAKHMSRTLDEMPTEEFQDWNFFESVMSFSERWGLCRGEVMPAYFRRLIYDQTGLDDPTFQELYDAGYKKELRVITTNLSRGDVTVFSYKTTPNKKVAEHVALSCSVPILFPPKWIPSAEGKLELHTDGGVIKNYPFGVGSSPSVPLEKQLGFVFVNGATAKKLIGEQKPLIQTFLQYIAELISAIVFQHPLTLSEPVKQRTIAIRVNHSPLKFNASPEEQQQLDYAGAEGVRSLISQMIARQRDEYKNSLRQAVHKRELAIARESSEEVYTRSRVRKLK